MRRAGRDAGGTINDVFVAGLLDGLRRYHDAHGRRSPELRIGVPLNLRTEGAAEAANAFAPGRIVAPLQIIDPAERIAAVHRLMVASATSRPTTSWPPSPAWPGTSPAWPPRWERPWRASTPWPPTSPALPCPSGSARRRSRALYPFGPRSGAGLNVTLLSYQGTAHLGVHVDPATTPDRKVLLDCLAEGMATTVGGTRAGGPTS